MQSIFRFLSILFSAIAISLTITTMIMLANKTTNTGDKQMIKYKIVRSLSIAGIEEAVNLNLKNGYELHGTTYLDDGFHCQPMVKIRENTTRDLISSHEADNTLSE